MGQGLVPRRSSAGRGRRSLRGLALAVSLAALSLAAAASPAAGSVTLGQLAPTPTGSISAIDLVPLTVTAGNGYVVPGTGRITSWSHNAGSGASQKLTMKVFRKVAEPNFYKVVGLDGPRDLDGGLLNTFPVSIDVQPGDVIGLGPVSGPVAPLFTGVTGDMFLFRSGDLGLGQAASFDPSAGSRLNLTAVFDPSNAITVGATKLNRRKGTAKLTLTLPNPGALTVAGKGAKVTSAGHPVSGRAVGAGKIGLLVRAKGRKRRALNRTGRAPLKLSITYRPTNGNPGKRVKRLKLRKRV
jgi:hypothetical protein